MTPEFNMTLFKYIMHVKYRFFLLANIFFLITGDSYIFNPFETVDFYPNSIPLTPLKKKINLFK